MIVFANLVFWMMTNQPQDLIVMYFLNCLWATLINTIRMIVEEYQTISRMLKISYTLGHLDQLPLVELLLVDSSTDPLEGLSLDEPDPLDDKLVTLLL